MSRYLFSKEAENDLIEIYRYSFLNYGESKADLYKETLREKCQFLAASPYLCCEQPKFTPPVRIAHHKKHLIVYTFMEDHIFIVRILHERMNVKQHLE